MKIAMIGTGYVGLVTGTCLAEMGHQMICLDIDEAKVDMLKKARSPIYEPGLEELIENNMNQKRIDFTTDAKKALEFADVCFLAVPTLCDASGRADLSHIITASETIGRLMTHPLHIVVKSTVPVGTTHQVREIIEDELLKREVSIQFSVSFNPEFLKEGSAIEDCMHPHRVILGTDDDAILRKVYAPFGLDESQIITMDIPSAEMTKYAANCMLATRISLMNEFAAICEKVDANIHNVRRGIGSDSRIGMQFLNSGVGFGGSCFPKDLSALRVFAKDHDCQVSILDAVSQVNDNQKHLIFNKMQLHFDSLEGKTISIWGLAFKPGTDDIREASAIPLIQSLIDAGAHLKLYDPVAMKNMKRIFPDVQYCENAYDAAVSSDAIALITEWDEFKSIDFEKLGPLMNQKCLFDGRGLFEIEELERIGFDYHGIGIPQRAQKLTRQKT